MKGKHHRGAAEEARLAKLHELSLQSWEGFIWEYRAPGASSGFKEAVVELFRSASPPLNLDYEFWIHVAVLWLFQKKTRTMTWPEAIAAYNGSGAHARHYSEAITRRAGQAKSHPAGRPFIPEGI